MKKDSIILRLIFIVAIVLLLLIPITMIQNLIDEREEYRKEAYAEIYKSWASPQIVAGPILSLKSRIKARDNDGKESIKTINHTVLPESLKMETELIPEKRYRGLYEVTLYKARIKISGQFNLKEFSDAGDLYSNLTECFISVNISDLRGIEENIPVKWNNKLVEAKSGLKDYNTLKNGFIADIKIDKDKPNHFEFLLQLKGSGNLQFIPVGKTTEVNMKADWSSPSFFGSFLPSTRRMDNKSFTAQWKVNHFNREYPQLWKNQSFNIFQSSFGVRLLEPIDEYQKIMRTTKYSIMIIILTFTGFFFIEIFGRKSLHPIQYSLIGLSLVIFYSVLLALSEYLLFKYSYLATGFLVITLISLYAAKVYSDKKIGVVIAGILFLFYGFMYVILQLQDYSLLLGNVALFIILAVIMYTTRKIDWFTVLSNKENMA